MQALSLYSVPANAKQLFGAANQSAQATTVALATTYTGIVLSNPNKSNVNLYLLRANWALSVAPAAISTIGIMGGFSTTDVTHTVALTPINSFLSGGNTTGKGLVDSSATLPVAPVWLEQISGGAAAAAFPAPLEPFDFGGFWCIPPGGFIAIGTLTATTGLGSLTWLEFPVGV